MLPSTYNLFATGRQQPQTNVARSNTCEVGAKYLPIVRYEGLFLSTWS